MHSYSPPISLLKPDLIWGLGDTRTYFASVVIYVVRFTPNLAPRWTLRPKLPFMSPVWADACHGLGSLSVATRPECWLPSAAQFVRQLLQQHLCRKVLSRLSRRSTNNGPAPKGTDISDFSFVFCLQSKRLGFTPTQIISCHLNTASSC